MSDISEKVAQIHQLLNELADIGIKERETVQAQSKQLATLQAQIKAIPKVNPETLKELQEKAKKYDSLKELMG